MLEIDTAGHGVVTVVVRGELDLGTAPALRAAITALLNRGDVTAIDLDIAGVGFMDSTGLGTLVVARRVCATVQVALRVTAISPFAARLLTVVGADTLLTAMTPQPAGAR